jgi:hypothetical protein
MGATLRRAGAVALMLAAALLSALVVLGMATGTGRQFDKGVVPLPAVILVQVLGAVSLLTVGGVVRGATGVWKGRRTHVVRWTALAVPIWLFWALLRVGEYAS